ncbi:MAG: hypothetical protein A3I01_01215 [Betaproteobacteria bacterium RIFCSPLOWO2_02_FULL_65_24]|nr:MAG: hypothetical protein A3I01_01215 [Betaproteobacteria bacterium RIFCSPLOWO2_02_FULL_65_24]
MRRKGLLTAAALLAAAAAWALTIPLMADEGHGHGAEAVSLSGSPIWWGVTSLGALFLAIFLSRAFLFRSRIAEPSGDDAPVGYLAAIRQLSRNARLFLAYSIMAELGTGIWAVMFNLYLIRLEYPITFIGTFWLVNMLCHGVAALPAGLIADRYGRRRSFFIATSISLIAQGSLLFTQDSWAILVLGGVAGFGEAFHGVTGAPFMMENSEPRERPHLFSLNSSFLQFSRFAGNLSGGFLPLLWAALLGVPALDPEVARWALLTGLPLTLVALLPLAFMREKPLELAQSFKELLDIRRLVNLGSIARLTLLSLMMGTAFGLTIRFFNVFFQDVHGASDSEIGTILALGSIAGATVILVSPLVTQSCGMVRGILYTQVLSIPFLLLMALVPSLSAVTVFFLLRGAMYSIAQPLRTQLSMELVTARERGTTAGFTHTAFDLGGGVGAGMAGLLIAAGGFTSAFTAAAVLIFVPAVLYYVFFAYVDSEAARRASMTAPASGSR